MVKLRVRWCCWLSKGKERGDGMVVIDSQAEEGGDRAMVTNEEGASLLLALNLVSKKPPEN